MSTQKKGRIAFAVCGSFCTLEAALAAAQQLTEQGWELLPIMSFAAKQDTRFGTGQFWQERLEALTGHTVLDTLQAVEPLGPKKLASALASFLGPSGSTACNVSNTVWPVRASSRSCQNCPVPKRVSCFAAKLMMGSSSQPCSVSCCAAASAASSVQKLPHTANAMRPFFCVLMCVPPAPAKWSARRVPPLPRPCPAHRRRAG